MTFKEYLAARHALDVVAFRQWWWIGLIVIVAGIVAVLVIEYLDKEE